MPQRLKNSVLDGNCWIGRPDLHPTRHSKLLTPEMSFQAQVRPPKLIRFYRWIWRFWKERRFLAFVENLQPRSDELLLDLGGYPFNWFQRGKVIREVHVLNLDLVPLDETPYGAPVIRAISGDARSLPFPDGCYDIVFSNSVVEHVGSFEDQKSFAKEARRVGKKIWIQTPARECPIEPHYLGLFIHWFPGHWHVPMARWLSLRGLTGSASRSDLEAIARSTRLLTREEMSQLFPDCQIWTERLLGIIPKSHVAIRRTSEGITSNE